MYIRVADCQGFSHNFKVVKIHSQPPIICSKLTIETLEQGVKYVQS